MSRNRSNFVRVMGTASAVVLSSTLAVPAVAVAADADGAVIVEQSYEEAKNTEAPKVVELINKIESPVSKNAQAFEDAYDAVYGENGYFKRFEADWTSDDPDAKTEEEYKALITNLKKLDDAAEEMVEIKAAAALANVLIDGDEDLQIAGLPDPEDINETNFADVAKAAAEAQEALDEFDKLAHPNYQDEVSADSRAQLKAVQDRVKEVRSGVDDLVEGTIAGVEAIVNKIDKEEVEGLDAAVPAEKTKLDTAQEWVDDAKKLLDDDLEQLEEKAGGEQYVKQITDCNEALTNAKNRVNRAIDNVVNAEAALEKALQKEGTDEKTIVDRQAELQRAKDALTEANDAYDDEVAKKDNLSDNQKKIIELMQELDDIQDAITNSPVDNAIAAIKKAIRYAESGRYQLPNPVRVAYAQKLVDNLNDEQRKALDTSEDANLYLDKLKKAQDALDKKAEDDARKEKQDADSKAAQQVVDLIDALPELADLDATDKDAVDAAADAYDALTDDQKALLSDADVKKLEDSKKLIEKFAPAPVVNAKVFRLYNPNSGEHFYTADAEEKDALETMGWTNETSDDNAWTSADETGTPVYRLYNPNAQGGDHHFSKDTAEVEALVKAGWVKDNGGKPVFYSADAETGVAIYRAYNGNENAHNHNYTPDKAEQDALVKAGWADEGVAFYGAPLLKDAE